MTSVSEDVGTAELCASLMTDPVGSEVQNEIVVTFSTFNDLGKFHNG